MSIQNPPKMGVKNPPERMPRVVPMLSYEHVGEAADWLCLAFGFRERLRYTAADGTLSHVQLELEDGLIMLGNPDGRYISPKRHAESCEVMRAVCETPYVSDGLHVYVDDVAVHYDQARRAGATVLTELEETPFGDLHYRVEDLEGHRWLFAEHVRDVAPADWGAETA
jgi:uncharacterized glyoxalase superfamily protein PhnB